MSKPKRYGRQTSMLQDFNAAGVHTIDFLEALSWSKDPAVSKAMFDIFERTDDLNALIAVLPSVNQTHPDKTIPRLRSLLKEKLPEEDKRDD